MSNIILRPNGDGVGLNLDGSNANTDIDVGANDLIAAEVRSDTAKFGDLSTNQNYTEIESDGTIKFNGDATVWDDLTVSATDAKENGANPPTYGLFKNNGVTGTGYALEFDASNSEYIQIPSDVSLNFDSGDTDDTTFSVGFLIKIEPGFTAGNLVTKAGRNWEIQIRNNAKIRVRTSSGLSFTSDNPLLIGVVNAVVVTFDCNSVDHTAEIWINGQSQGADISLSALTDVTAAIYVNSYDTSLGFADFEMDELRIWNSVLTSAQIIAFYANGAGTESSIATEIVGYHFNEGSSTDCANFASTDFDIDMTASGNDPAWITGFISAGSRGVFVHWFDPDITQELFFNRQVLHGYKLGTNFVLHVHWVPKTAGATESAVRWGAEFNLADINGIYGNTTIIYGSSPAGGDTTLIVDKHYMTDLTTIDGSGISGVSAMFNCRVFRDASHVDDTYDGYAGLKEIDFHYEKDTVGSRQIATK